MKIIIETIVKPTEDLEKVKKAVRNIFDGEIRVVNEKNNYYRIEGFSNSETALNKFYNLIRTYQIMAAARSYLLKGLHGKTITLLLHKQAAYMNKISFIDSDKESPLGAIKIVVEADDPMKIIDWLAPPYTRKTRKTRGR